MQVIKVTTVSKYSNVGERAEQNLVYTLLGVMRNRDSIPFFNGSDIPEYHMSVKASHFTLASGRLMRSQTLDGQIEEYFERTASSLFAYVSMEDKAYIMDESEFREFLYAFGRLEKDSAKNGGFAKVRFPMENKYIRKWLAEREGF